MKINREHIKNTFQEYTDRYDSTDPKIKLKIDHTYRVADLCERIAKSLDLLQEDIDLAWLSGMLHDIGRFEQLRRYHTFSDAQSIDHAKFAVELLYEDGLIADYVPEISMAKIVTNIRTKDGGIDPADKRGAAAQMSGECGSSTGLSEDMPLSDVFRTLRIAIGEHSAYRIQEGLDKRTQMFCHILRDADKVDIFRVICDTPMEEVYGFQTEDILRSGITPEVRQAFLEHHAVLRSLKKQPADYVVAHGSLAFELVYLESLRIAKEQGYLGRMMSFQSENPETAKEFEHLRKDLNDYLEQRSQIKSVI